MILQYGLIAVTIFTAILYWIIFEGRKNRPPGPWGLPIVGHLLFLNKIKPHESLADIAWRCGPVCSLRMGSVYTVLITDPKIMRKAFAMDEVTGRAPLYLTHGIMKGYGLIAAEGLIWKEHRKFTIQSLKNLGMVKNASSKRDELETKISLFVDEAVSKLEKRTNAESGLEPKDTLHHCIGNFMNSVVFGKTYDEDDELWKWMQLIQEEGVKHIGVSGPLNFLPVLRFLPNYMKPMKLILDGQKKTHDVYRDIMREFMNNEIDSGRAPNECNSILAYYAKQIKDIKSKAPVAYPELYSETQMYYVLADMYGAGVDTTLTTLRWFLLFMAANPSEQAKVHEEMDAVLGDKIPTLCDRPLLIRLEAAMMESQRLRSVVPTGIPHGTTKATQIDGYDIPKGAMVMPLLWGIHLNPKYFPNPLHYMPDRFIAEDGSLLKPEAYVPFQLGNRMCLGMEMARMMLFLFGARILHRFQLAAPSDQPIDLEGEVGITLVPKAQRILFQPRL